MLITIGLQEEATGIAIVLPCSGEPIEVIVETFPLGCSISDVLEVSIMQFSSLFQVLLNLDEVVADDASELTSVDEDQELGFDTGVEVHLDHGGLVTVDTDVLELLKLSCEVLIILLELGNHGVPLGCEVEEGEQGTFFIQILYHFF